MLGSLIGATLMMAGISLLLASTARENGSTTSPRMQISIEAPTALSKIDGQGAVKSGKRVFVDIVPHYRGTSMRPYKLVVRWSVGGSWVVRDFPNERQTR